MDLWAALDVLLIAVPVIFGLAQLALMAEDLQRFRGSRFWHGVWGVTAVVIGFLVGLQQRHARLERQKEVSANNRAIQIMAHDNVDLKNAVLDQSRTLAAIKNAFEQTAKAANVSTNGEFQKIADAIIAKLPPPSVNRIGPLKNSGIVTQGQSGGINTINNVPEKPSRTLADPDVAEVLSSIPPDRATTLGVRYMTGSRERSSLATLIAANLTSRGYAVALIGVADDLKPGISLKIPSDTKSAFIYIGENK